MIGARQLGGWDIWSSSTSNVLLGFDVSAGMVKPVRYGRCGLSSTRQSTGNHNRAAFWSQTIRVIANGSWALRRNR